MEQKIYNLLDNYVNEIFLKMQEEFNIQTGDVSPEDAYDLYEKENELTVLIGKILRIQRGEI